MANIEKLKKFLRGGLIPFNTQNLKMTARCKCIPAAKIRMAYLGGRGAMPPNGGMATNFYQIVHYVTLLH